MSERVGHVAVIGPGDSATPDQLRAAEEVGAALAERGAVVLTGGLGGVMHAATVGASRAGGLTVGLLPDRDRSRADPDCTVTIPTGLGELRNGLLVRAADAVVCVGLSWGTLSEVALAMRTGVPVVMLGTWPGPLTGPVSASSPGEAATLAVTFAEH